MDSLRRTEEREERSAIILPHRTLLVLCGSAGAGKSTFAQKLIAAHKKQGFKPTMIVSSDHCRALVCDNENNQQINRDSFDLFHYIIHKRMFHGHFTVADSTALKQEARLRLLELAQRHNYHHCLLIFNIPSLVCLQRDQRRHRFVGEQVIAYHTGLLQQTFLEAPNEGWEQIHVLGENEKDITITVTVN